jgi:hypothetical protein
MAPTDINITISGNIVAFYGAILATVTACAQVLAFLRDRTRIKISVRPNMQKMDNPRYEGKTVTIMTVANCGRRPVTITGTGFVQLHPFKAAFLFDNTPDLPCELTEGKYLMTLVDESVDTAEIEYWYAVTAANKYFKLRVAPWYKRWRSATKRYLAYRKPPVLQK